MNDTHSDIQSEDEDIERPQGQEVDGTDPVAPVDPHQGRQPSRQAQEADYDPDDDPDADPDMIDPLRRQRPETD